MFGSSHFIIHLVSLLVRHKLGLFHRIVHGTVGIWCDTIANGMCNFGRDTDGDMAAAQLISVDPDKSHRDSSCRSIYSMGCNWLLQHFHCNFHQHSRPNYCVADAAIPARSRIYRKWIAVQRKCPETHFRFGAGRTSEAPLLGVERTEPARRSCVCIWWPRKWQTNQPRNAMESQWSIRLYLVRHWPNCRPQPLQSMQCRRVDRSATGWVFSSRTKWYSGSALSASKCCFR